MTTKIIGTGRGIPKKAVTNEFLSTIMDTSDEWISSRTGIRQRYIAIEETTTSMAVEAAEKAMADAGIKPDEIDIIIAGTVSGDMCFPSMACMVQKEIGANRAVAYDLSAGCSGFLFALNTAHAYIKSGIYECALIIGSETLSKMMDWNDRSTCVLFGDGAGAAIVRKADTGLIETVQYSDGSKGEVLACKNRLQNNPFVKNETSLSYTYMEGQDVFKFAVKKVPECIIEVLQKAKTDIKEVDYFVLHQANKRIIQSVAKRLKIEEEKFPLNLQNYGNTSAASIPILLDEMKEDGLLKAGTKIIVSGFGAGLTWGAALIEF